MVKIPNTYAAVKSVSDEELIQLYDLIGVSTQIGLKFIADKIQHRNQARTNRSMRNLTWVIVGLTSLNTVFVYISAFS